MNAFTPEYVEGLRREGQRKGQTIRALKAALIGKAVALEAHRQGIAPDLVEKINTLGVTVTESGDVQGAADAVARFKRARVIFDAQTS